MQATIQSINLISTAPHVRGGRPCVAGTSIEVAVIAIEKIIHGRTPEDIAADYELSLPQVYAAIAYYYAHKDQIDAAIQERHKFAQAMKEQRIGSRH
jgi:uncharacterized protein (DUF433 family)